MRVAKIAIITENLSFAEVEAMLGEDCSAEQIRKADLGILELPPASCDVCERRIDDYLTIDHDGVYRCESCSRPWEGVPYIRERGVFVPESMERYLSARRKFPPY